MANHPGAPERRKKYALLVAKTGNSKFAAQESGYVTDKERFRLSSDPKIVAQVALERARLFNMELGGLAYSCLVELLTVPKTPPAVRFQAAKFVMESLGHGKADAVQAPDTDKPLADMTLAELGAFIRQGEATLNAMRERAIEHNPESNTQLEQVEALEVADLLG